MRTQRICTCLALVAATSASWAWAQISGTSDIDQQGTSKPVYGQSPQSSKMTPGGSKGKSNDTASSGSSGNADGTAASGNDRKPVGKQTHRAGRDRERESNTRDDDRTRAGSEESSPK
ncbi:hypothetical protein E4K72_17800 [Oxalobacteraceae bacterium OM1]|nr:hypothetical protein E4K72_17800 [Oxalobacteraceae bacterium OM1]